MPKLNKEQRESTGAANTKLQKETFPDKANKVIRDANAKLARGGVPREERVRLERARRSARRVLGRLDKETKTKGPAKSTPASRRKIVEKATGTSAIINPLKGVAKLAKNKGGK